VEALLDQVEVRAIQAPVEPLDEDVRFDHMLILGETVD
jgi:hypothetical protein